MYSIKNFTPRLYQETILATAAQKNTLVVLATGLGKTNIFLMLAAHRLKLYPKSKILLLGPTRPLIDQYRQVFLENFEIGQDELVTLTGMVAPEKRQQLWKQAKVIFSTPQGLENDLISGRISLEDVALLGFDEAHRATGEYAYVWIGKQYLKQAKFARVLALTASPGSEIETITEVAQNLGIEGIEVRTESDPDVRPYIQDIEIDFVPVTLPESIGDIQVLLKASFAEKLKALKKTGLAPNINTRYATKKDLLGLQAELHQDIARGARDGKLWQAVSVMAELMKLQHALELAETQSVESLTKYLDTIKAQAEKKATKAVKSLMNDAYFKTAMFKAYELLDKKVEHPKIEEIKKIVRKEVSSNPNAKVIVFNQYRDSASQMLEELNNIPGIRAAIFVGQMKKGETGLSQKEQKAVLDRFRQGEINVLVSTSVGEEGLDVPAVDLVVFYEPIPSAIRTIQRRGRTARQKEGRVVVLVTKGTRDEAYRWTAHHKEKRMHRTLKELKDKLGLVKLKEKQPTLKEFAGSKIVVFADHREKGSGAIKELLELNVELKLEQLAIGDYILSKRVAVEFKTVQDFVNSLIDGRLFEQVKSIKESFPKPLIMVEGEESIYGVRNVHPNAINGMLAAIAVDFGVPVLYTKTARESAAMLYTIAKREQDELGVSFSPHADKHVTSLPEQQEYIVSSFPGIGTALARPLLKHFKTIKNIANASEQDLQGVTLIGKKKAAEIRKVLDGEYRP